MQACHYAHARSGLHDAAALTSWLRAYKHCTGAAEVSPAFLDQVSFYRSRRWRVCAIAMMMLGHADFDFRSCGRHYAIYFHEATPASY